MSVGLKVNCPLFLSDLNKLQFSGRDFRKIVQYQKCTSIRRLRVELFRAEGRTDVAKLIVAFRNLAKAPKTVLFKTNTLT
jgi:hypothetical protein